MIDINSEQLLPVREVPAWYEEHFGQRVHISTIYRWWKRGACGVVLETFRAGGSRYTSIEALQRFFAASTAAAEGDNIAVHFDDPGRAYDQAESILDSDGV